MPVALILLAVILCITLIGYALYRVIRSYLGESMPDADYEAGLKAAIENENKRIDTIKKWRDTSKTTYAQSVTTHEVLGDELDEHNQRALWNNVERAEEALEAHQERLEDLKHDALDRNIQV